jgi:uncharacterized protein YkwD
MSRNINYEEIEQELFKAHNQIRKDPQSYIQKLKECLNHFRDKIYHQPGEDPIQTYEGKDAIEEAIRFLKNQKPVKELVYSEELSLSASDHVLDIGENNLCGHRGSNKSTLNDRIEKYIEWNGLISESIQYCYQFANNIIMSLLIDDGSKDKHQRLNLFSEDYNYVGIACGAHKKYQMCTVLNYAKDLFPLGTEPPTKKDINYNLNVSENENEVIDIEGNIVNKDYKPENASGVEIYNITKNYNGKDHPFTRKIFHLNNGKMHIIDLEES